MKIKITLTEEMLGTASADPEIHAKFIASKSKDAEKLKEELATLGADEAMEKALTVFPRDEDGQPILFDYQVKGFIKEAVGILLELDEKEIKVGKTKLSKFTHKRLVDNYIFVSPRKIRLSNSVGGICTRPLRADTMKGERVSLASSETVPAGTTFECEIETLAESLNPLVKKCLDYGAKKGLGQWRNSSKGRFAWEVVEG
jgi:hypothetical protein